MKSFQDTMLGPRATPASEGKSYPLSGRPWSAYAGRKDPEGEAQG